VSVPRALAVVLWAPGMYAEHVARFEAYATHHCLPPTPGHRDLQEAYHRDDATQARRTICARGRCGLGLTGSWSRASAGLQAPHASPPYWVGTGRVALRYVSPCPPLDPYVRLSPHTAHDRGLLWERSISPAPWCIPHGQLCACAGYLCTVSRPSPSGPSPCT